MERRMTARAWLTKTAVRIATDATWVFAIVIVLSLGSSFFSIHYLSGLDSDVGDLFENDIKGQTYAQNAYVTLVSIESAAKDLIISESDEARMASFNALRTESAALRSLVLKVTPTIDSAKYRTLIAKSKGDASAFIDVIQKNLEPMNENGPTAEQGRSLLADIKPRAAALKNDLLTLNDIKRRANLRGFRAVRIQLRVSLVTTIVILVVSLAVRIFLYRASRKAARVDGAARGSS
jgi:hypothetical protein